MLPQSSLKIVSHANIKKNIVVSGEDVNVPAFLHLILLICNIEIRKRHSTTIEIEESI